MGKENDTANNQDNIKLARVEVSEFLIGDTKTENDSILLRVAFAGDGEPKPLPEFPGREALVEHINIYSHVCLIGKRF